LKCGFTVAPDSRFCAGCGAALGKEQATVNREQGEYQQTTILDFSLMIKDNNDIEGKFVAEANFINIVGTKIFFSEPGMDTTSLPFDLTFRPPQMKFRQPVKIYFERKTVSTFGRSMAVMTLEKIEVLGA